MDIPRIALAVYGFSPLKLPAYAEMLFVYG